MSKRITTGNDAFEFKVGDTHYEFYPQGQQNPPEWSADKPLQAYISGEWGGGWSAKLFVGLSVAGRPTWAAEQVQQAVLQHRREQVMDWLNRGIISGGSKHYVEHGGSIVPQLGYWEKVTKKHGEEHATENSVSVEVLNLPEVGFDIFKKAIADLALTLCVEFRQMAIIVQFLEAGTVKHMLEVKTRNM
jgi:hypothetical protein